MTYLHKRPDPLLKQEVKSRMCLKCQMLFLSADGSRICSECTKKNKGYSRRAGHESSGSGHHAGSTISRHS